MLSALSCVDEISGLGMTLFLWHRNKRWLPYLAHLIIVTAVETWPPYWKLMTATGTHSSRYISPAYIPHMIIHNFSVCFSLRISGALQFEPAPRRGEPDVTRRTPDYFL